MSNEGGIDLGPFEYIVEIHWESIAVTKLDFFWKKYMVRGKMQLLADVLGDDLVNELDIVVRDGATQRSYVTVDGLDLRKYDGGGDLTIASKQAFLKNKTAEPDYKENPGALNEFLFNEGVLVIEFDWIDVPGIINSESGGGFPEGIDIVYWIYANRNNEANLYFALSNAELMQDGAGDTTASTGSWSWPHVSGNNYGPPVLFLPPGTDPDFIAEALYPAPLQGPVGVVTTMPDDYVPHTELFAVPGVWDSEPYTMVPYLATYDTTGGANPIDGRMIGASPDTINNSAAPMNNGQLSAPYGRVRVAMRITDAILSVSVNGGPIFTKEQDGLGTIPRVPPDAPFPLTGPLPYFPNNQVGSQKPYEVAFDFNGVVRCVWLYRALKTRERRKFDALNLKTLSAVRPLTPPDNLGLWKKT